MFICIGRSQWPRDLRRRLGLRQLGCWDRGFESRWGHGWLSRVYIVLFCVGRGLCDGLITSPEESYRARARARVCVCVCVWLRNLNKDEAKTQIWAVVPQERNNVYVFNIYTLYEQWQFSVTVAKRCEGWVLTVWILESWVLIHLKDGCL
jgi:hypothetical protein